MQKTTPPPISMLSELEKYLTDTNKQKLGQETKFEVGSGVKGHVDQIRSETLLKPNNIPRQFPIRGRKKIENSQSSHTSTHMNKIGEKILKSESTLVGRDFVFSKRERYTSEEVMKEVYRPEFQLSNPIITAEWKFNPKYSSWYKRKLDFFQKQYPKVELGYEDNFLTIKGPSVEVAITITDLNYKINDTLTAKTIELNINSDAADFVKRALEDDSTRPILFKPEWKAPLGKKQAISVQIEGVQSFVEYAATNLLNYETAFSQKIVMECGFDYSAALTEEWCIKNKVYTHYTSDPSFFFLDGFDKKEVLNAAKLIKEMVRKGRKINKTIELPSIILKQLDQSQFVEQNQKQFSKATVAFEGKLLKIEGAAEQVEKIEECYHNLSRSLLKKNPLNSQMLISCQSSTLSRDKKLNSGKSKDLSRK